jgi:adenosine deaminase
MLLPYVGEFMDWCRRSYLTAAVPSIQAHPARALWAHGIPLCVNTDDPGIMAIDVNHEWQLWSDELGFSDVELSAMTGNQICPVY